METSHSNRSKFYLFVALLFCLSAETLHGQDAKPQSWVRVQDSGDKFSVALPSTYQSFTDKKGFKRTSVPHPSKRQSEFKTISMKNIRYVTASDGKASFWVIRYNTNSPKEALDSLLQFSPTMDEVVRVSFGGFTGYSFYDQTEHSYSQHLLLLSGDTIYHLLGAARTRETDSLKFFFSSLRLSGQVPFKLAHEMSEPSDNPLILDDIPDSPFTVEKVEAKKGPVAKVEVPKNRSRFVMLVKPLAHYTPEARGNNVQGSVRLRVVLRSDGSIDRAGVVKGLDDGLTEEAIRALRLLRFLPAEIDGKAIDSTITIDYSFSIY